MTNTGPTAEAVYAYAQANGIKLEPGDYWDKETRCGCFVGIAAIMKNRELEHLERIDGSMCQSAIGVNLLGVAGAVHGFDGSAEDPRCKHRALYRRMYAEGRKLRLMIEPDAFGPVET